MTFEEALIDFFIPGLCIFVGFYREDGVNTAQKSGRAGLRIKQLELRVV